MTGEEMASTLNRYRAFLDVVAYRDSIVSDNKDYQNTEPRAGKPTTGAQFSRVIGTDAEKWATEFLAAYAQADHVKTDAERKAFIAKWFRDAMNAALDAHKDVDVQ